MPMASELSEAAIKRASDSIQAVKHGHAGTLADGPARTNRRLYTPDNPLEGVPFAAKVKLLEEIDAYARAPRSAGAPGLGIACRQLAGGRDHPLRRRARLRHPPAGAPFGLDRRRRRRPAGVRLLFRGRAH